MPAEVAVDIVGALVVGLATFLATPRTLGLFREPQLEPGETKIPYASLATPRFALGAGTWALALALAALLAVPTDRAAPLLVLAPVAALAAAIDIPTTWIPQRLLHAGWVAVALTVAINAAALGDELALLRAVVGAAAVGGFFFVVHEVSARFSTAIFGFSDVRLAFLTGGVSGWVSWSTIWSGAFLGMVVGAAWGLVTALRRKRDGPFAYGPSVALGPYLAVLVAWLQSSGG